MASSLSSSVTALVLLLHLLLLVVPSLGFRVTLKAQKTDELRALITAVSDPDHGQYLDFLTPAQLHDRFAPSEADVQAVQQWLGVDATQVTKYNGRRWLLLVNGTNPASARVVPAHLRHIVRGVHNGSAATNPTSTTATRGASTVSTPPGPTTHPFTIPQIIHARYNAPDPITYAMLNTVKRLSIGVVGESNNFLDSDLNKYAAVMGMKTPLTITSYNRQPNSPVDTESSTDMNMITVHSPQGTNLTYINNNSPDWNGWCEQILSLNDIPMVLSTSWWQGEVEGTGYEDGHESCLMMLGVAGSTVVAASGNLGAPGWLNPQCDMDHYLNVEYPSNSPWVTAVGATAFTGTAAAYNAFPNVPFCNGSFSIGQLSSVYGIPPGYYDPTGYFTCTNSISAEVSATSFCSGGGTSFYLPVPSWQVNATKAYFSRTDITFPSPSLGWSAQYRALPDVAVFGNSDAQIGINMVVQNGQWNQNEGGTSLSAPRFGALMLYLIDKNLQLTGKPLGFINPLLYKMFADAPELFNDVTVGYNGCTPQTPAAQCTAGGFHATPGWDAVGGLGSPNIGLMVQYLVNTRSAAPNNQWQWSAWGACAANHVQTRQVACVSLSPYIPVANTQCVGLVKPPTFQSC